MLYMKYIVLYIQRFYFPISPPPPKKNTTSPPTFMNENFDLDFIDFPTPYILPSFSYFPLYKNKCAKQRKYTNKYI